MLPHERVDEHVEVGDVIGVLHLAAQKKARVPGVAITAERRAFRIHHHEALRPSDRVEARVAPHDLGAPHAPVQHDHRWSFGSIGRGVDDDRPAILTIDLEGDDGRFPNACR
jgi:hypothetical protein